MHINSEIIISWIYINSEGFLEQIESCSTHQTVILSKILVISLSAEFSWKQVQLGSCQVNGIFLSQSSLSQLLGQFLVTSKLKITSSFVPYTAEGNPDLLKSAHFSRSVVSTLCDPMHCSTPGLPVPHQHSEFTQTQVH